MSAFFMLPSLICGRSEGSLLAKTGLSLQVRNLVSSYEEADVRQHATFSTAANGSKEPK
jgi:hypothetical protein